VRLCAHAHDMLCELRERVQVLRVRVRVRVAHALEARGEVVQQRCVLRAADELEEELDVLGHVGQRAGCQRKVRVVREQVQEAHERELEFREPCLGRRGVHRKAHVALGLRGGGSVQLSRRAGRRARSQC
jgi:hypothetical protein